MEKNCFIIMPISDPSDYSNGHFKRVYDFLIRPACELAGFRPIRADDVLNTNYIALDVVKYIIQADMALCDLSSRNPNVLYELGIRQAFNKPVTLIKDTKTPRVFDISGFRDVEYDESLRIDSVQVSTEVIAETLKNTHNSSGQEVNSLISLLGIEPAEIDKNIQISPDTELIINSINNLEFKIKELEEKAGSKFDFTTTTGLNSNLDYMPHTEVLQLKPGERVRHAKFGDGIITKMEGSNSNPIAVIDLDTGVTKKIMLNYARFARI